MVWDTGTFEFAIDDLRPIDDIALYPSDVLPDADINTQMVLLEAARIFDERSRNAAGEAEPPDARRGRPALSGDDTNPSLVSAAGAAVAMAEQDEEDFDLFGGPSWHRAAALQVVSTDQALVDRLSRALAGARPLGHQGEPRPGRAGARRRAAAHRARRRAARRRHARPDERPQRSGRPGRR